MKTKLSVLFLAFSLLASCGHKRGQEAEQAQKTLDKVSSYYQEWKQEYNPNTPKEKDFAQKYEQYLRSVAGIFMESENPKQIEAYLEGLKNNYRELASADKKLNKVAASSKKGSLDRTKAMTELNDKLNQERIDELRAKLDKDVFKKIEEVNKQFAMRYEQGGPGYNYPL